MSVNPQRNDVVLQIAKHEGNNKKSQTGFTLIEVLVSLVILSIGLLGIFAMQSRALMDNQDAYLRTQAIFLASDMSDRIRANAGYWKNKTPTTLSIDIATAMTNASAMTSTSHPFCSTYDPTTAALAATPTTPGACSLQQMAEYDTYRWMADVNVILPGATTAISREIDSNSTNASKDIIRIKIDWARANQDAQNNMGTNATYFLDVRL